MDISTDKKDFFLFAFTYSKPNFKGEIKIKLINDYRIDFKSVETIFISNKPITLILNHLKKFL